MVFGKIFSPNAIYLLGWDLLTTIGPIALRKVSLARKGGKLEQMEFLVRRLTEVLISKPKISWSTYD